MRYNLASFESLANMILASFLQFKKALNPISVTFDGIEILVIEEFSNELFEISVYFELLVKVTFSRIV